MDDTLPSPHLSDFATVTIHDRPRLCIKTDKLDDTDSVCDSKDSVTYENHESSQHGLLGCGNGFIGSVGESYDDNVVRPDTMATLDEVISTLADQQNIILHIQSVIQQEFLSNKRLLIKLRYNVRALYGLSYIVIIIVLLIGSAVVMT
jgi:hypothetical protein